MPLDFEDRGPAGTRDRRSFGTILILSEFRPQTPISIKFRINFVFDDNKIILNISNEIAYTWQCVKDCHAESANTR